MTNPIARGTVTKRRVVIGAALLVPVLLLVTDPFARSRIRAPVPDTAADIDTEPEIRSSVLTVPIRIELGALINEIEDEIPVEWGDLEEWHEATDDLSIALNLVRGPFVGGFSEGVARLSTTIAYSLRGRYDLPLLPDVEVSCGTGESEPRPRMDVALAGPLTLTPDWRLSTTTRVERVAPTTTDERDECEVSFVDVNVTDRVVEMATSFLEEHGPEIDSIVADANVRENFEEWWAVLREPIELDDRVWLDMRPSGITRGEVSGGDRMIEVATMLTAKPRIVLGERPIPWDRELPPLGSGTPETGLRILLEGAAEYPSASARLTESLGGTVFQRSGRELRIRSLELIGIGGGRVALAVEIGGDLSGRIYFVGTPVHDGETGVVSIPDLRLDVSSSNLLVAGASWVGDLGLELALRERARWSLTPAVEFAAEKLHDGLNRELTDGVRLQGTVDEDSIRVLRLSARTDRLVVWVEARAEASLLVDESV